MGNNSRRPVRIAVVALVACLGASFLGFADQQLSSLYAFEEVFAFGLWGTDIAPYNGGLEGLLRDMRRAGMNCFVDAPRLSDPFEPGGAKETASQRIVRLQAEVRLCERYGVKSLVYVGARSGSEGLDVASVREAAAALRGEWAVLGWDVEGEPEPAFLPTFETYSAAIQSVAPRHPAVCMFYRPDSTAAFAEHQPLLLTDCYPVGIMHDGTSLGPHFAVREGPLRLSQNMGRFNMWGARGVLEWMDLCRACSGGLPHWVTLQVFESGDGRQVRWRQPTVSELRLQTFLAVAGGAKGVQYFRYGLLVDSYGNALPSLNGEHTPLWDEIRRLGALLTPMGPLFVDADVSEPVTSITLSRPTKAPGDGIETRRLRSKTRDVDYVIAWNDDTLLRHSAIINLALDFVHGRKVYDVGSLRAVETEAYAGAIACPVDLEPGDAAVLSVAAEADWSWQKNTVLKGRCHNEAGATSIDYELARKSGCALDKATRLQRDYQDLVTAGVYEGALARIRLCGKAVAEAMETKTAFHAAQQDLGSVKSTLAKLEREAKPTDPQVTKTYCALLRRFWDGEAEAIRGEASGLRQTLEGAVQSP